MSKHEINPNLRGDVDRAPKDPGCYLFRDDTGTVLYVGKAKVLRNRVRAYLRPHADGRLRIPEMVMRARELEYVITSSEKEALILENNLIKLHKPRFNVMLKDDKTY
ncbi:MAG: GIY-YIG nuclease family protein, partial [Planctomycetes bacterium]|nr:GIY-YIG nuclease family protein [Planctomycetota bacterium]